jgi:hypothetical protein
VLFALLYLLLGRVVRLIAGSSNDLDRDIELAVLRDQLMVLKRHVAGRDYPAATGCSWQRSAVFSPMLGGRRDPDNGSVRANERVPGWGRPYLPEPLNRG